MPNLFDGATDQQASVAEMTPEAILDAVKQKFKNDKGELDVVALAKGKLEADSFIKTLTDENAQFRQDQNSRTQLEELIQDLRKARQDASSQDNQDSANGNGPQGDKQPLTLDAVKELIQGELSSTQKQVQAQRNIDFAEAELTKQWGTSTRSRLEAKARELDVSLDFLKGIAANKPKAFLEMVGARPNTQVQTNSFTPPPSRITPVQSDSSTKERTQSYYQKLRKDNRALYDSAAVQKQEMDDALRMGEAFFDV